MKVEIEGWFDGHLLMMKLLGCWLLLNHEAEKHGTWLPCLRDYESLI